MTTNPKSLVPNPFVVAALFAATLAVEGLAKAGARSAKAAVDEGFMYSRGFQDPDGHLWDFVWMDPSAIGG